MIHKYKFQDKYIVMDINSGAIHQVNSLVYDLLDNYNLEGIKIQDENLNRLIDKYGEKEIAEAGKEIDYLIENQMLFSDDSEVAREILKERGALVKAMCFHIAHDCNMACKYCFGDTGAFWGERSLMSLETGQKAIDFLLKNSGERHNLEIDFFGGEPLMNFDVVKELVAYGREREKNYGKNIRFTITTNGLLLDEDKRKFINQHMDNVILSIDGRPEINDRMRTTINNKGTYDKIIDNFKNFSKEREGLYYVRGTFTKHNLDFSEDVRHLVDLGFRNISVEPVVTDPEKPYALSEKDLDEICKEYERLAELYLEYEREGREFSFFHFNIDLRQGPCVIKRVSGCGAGTEYLAISPEGDIYPCHQFVGEKEYMIGNVHEEEFNNSLYDTFNNVHIYNKEECMNCWARFYCSGGCHANAVHMNEDILKPYKLGCDLEKKRIECAIGIKISLLSS